MKYFSSQQTGQMAEERALNYLKKQGLKFAAKNYNCRLGELDLIMRDGPYLVFIEVRSRSNTTFGGGIASITLSKRQKVIKAAAHYMMQQQLFDKVPVRFDVISIDGASGELTWLKDAFGVDY
ncbi:MAG: YraN family protein [Legionellales bacterium]